MLILRTRPFAVAPLCLAGILAMAGCAHKPDDAQIATSIQTQVQADPAVTGEVKVESKGGLVTLSGHVSSEAERALVEREAAAATGVVGVFNDLTVEASTKPASRKGSRNRPPASVSSTISHSKESPVTNDTPSDSGATASSAVIAETAPPSSAAAAIPPAVPAAPAPPAAPIAPAPRAPSVPVAAPAPPPAPVKYIIEAGTAVSVRLIDSLDSARNKVGDTFRATLKIPLRVDGDVVIPAGVDVEGRVVDASNAGRFTGHSELNLELMKLRFDGEDYPLQTQGYDRADDGRGKGTAETVGGGAALGAIIGAIAGGGKGAAIGTAAGAGAGGATRASKSAKRITFPSETVLVFKLQNPVTVVTTKKAGESAASR